MRAFIVLLYILLLIIINITSAYRPQKSAGREIGESTLKKYKK